MLTHRREDVRVWPTATFLSSEVEKDISEQRLFKYIKLHMFEKLESVLFLVISSHRLLTLTLRFGEFDPLAASCCQNYCPISACLWGTFLSLLPVQVLHRFQPRTLVFAVQRHVSAT